MALKVHLQSLLGLLVFLIFASLAAMGNPLGRQSSLGNCTFPQTDSELRTAMQVLINKTKLFHGGQADARALEFLQRVQEATPLPVMKYLCDSSYSWACSGDDGRVRVAPQETPSDDAWSSLYAQPAEDQVDLHGQCEWAHLRPRCTFDRTLFPPILCQTRCRCSRRSAKSIDLWVIKIDRCKDGKLEWKLKNKKLIPIKYNACSC